MRKGILFMKNDARTSTISVKLTSAEDKALRQAAELAGVSVSSLARNLMRKGNLDKLVSSFLPSDAQSSNENRVEQ